MKIISQIHTPNYFHWLLSPRITLSLRNLRSEKSQESNASYKQIVFNRMLTNTRWFRTPGETSNVDDRKQNVTPWKLYDRPLVTALWSRLPHDAASWKFLIPDSHTLTKAKLFCIELFHTRVVKLRKEVNFFLLTSGVQFEELHPPKIFVSGILVVE